MQLALPYSTMDNRVRETGLQICVYMGFAGSACVQDIRSKTATLGMHQFKTNSMVQKVSLRSIPV